MVRYTLIWMGPCTTKWYEDNGIDRSEDRYSAGRIEVRGVTGDPHGYDYSVSMMKSESWYKFGLFLRGLETEYVWTYKEILFEFQKNNKIEWFENE